MEKTKTVEAYIKKNEKWKKELKLLRAIVLKTELQETIKWGVPVYTLNGKNVLGIGAFKEFFGMWFFNGALLKDPHSVLINAQEGKTKALRQWRFKAMDEIHEKRILPYIEEAVLNQRKGKTIKPEANSAWTMPVELADAFKENKKLYKAYQDLTLYKQKEYAEYINEVKQQSTKQKRLEKIIPMILNGTGLNDKYR